MGGLWGLGSNSNSLAVPPCVSFYLGATLGCFDGAVAKLKSQICASLPLVSFLSTRRAVSLPYTIGFVFFFFPLLYQVVALLLLCILYLCQLAETLFLSYLGLASGTLGLRIVFICYDLDCVASAKQAAVGNYRGEWEEAEPMIMIDNAARFCGFPFYRNAYTFLPSYLHRYLPT